MGDDLERSDDPKISRGGLLKIGAAAVGTTVLAACGSSGGDEEAAAPAPPAEPAATPEPAPPAAPEPPPIEDENGKLVVFEWAGYEHPTYGGLTEYVDQYGVPQYTFLTSDDQALGKVRAGFKPDIVHPCVSYVNDWVTLGAVQPWDTSLLTNFPDLNPALVENGKIDGKQYFIPADWGFSSPLYRADKVEPEGGVESWNMYFDERYKGKISWWDTPLENFLIYGYTQGFDPYNWDLWTDAQLDEAKKYLIEKKKLVRNFWSSQTDLDADIANGNVWIAYAWGASYTAAKKAGLDVVYSEPKEGRLGWNCGLVLGAETENYRHAHAYADAWISQTSAAWIIPNYAYGHANTKVDLSGVPPELVAAFHLDDPTATQEPNAHFERYVPDRRRFAKAWDEIKAA
jgi:spermidine/putrescine-binding protein